MHVPEQPYGSVYLPLVGMDLRFVSARDNGSLCIELNPTVGSTHFSLVGTPDELHWLCDKLRAIVTAHESATTLAGEAAKTAANLALLAGDDRNLAGDGFTPSDLAAQYGGHSDHPTPHVLGGRSQ